MQIRKFCRPAATSSVSYVLHSAGRIRPSLAHMAMNTAGQGVRHRRSRVALSLHAQHVHSCAVHVGSSWRRVSRLELRSRRRRPAPPTRLPVGDKHHHLDHHELGQRADGAQLVVCGLRGAGRFCCTLRQKQDGAAPPAGPPWHAVQQALQRKDAVQRGHASTHACVACLAWAQLRARRYACCCGPSARTW